MFSDALKWTLKARLLIHENSKCIYLLNSCLIIKVLYVTPPMGPCQGSRWWVLFLFKRHAYECACATASLWMSEHNFWTLVLLIMLVLELKLRLLVLATHKVTSQTLWSIKRICVCARACACTGTMACVWRSEDELTVGIDSLMLCGLGDWTQSVRFGCKCLYLSHLLINTN